MSVDLFVFPTDRRFIGSDIRAVFGEFASQTDYGLLLEYDAENNAFVYERLSEALFAFMANHNACLASPDSDPPLRVTSEEALAAALVTMPDAEVLRRPRESDREPSRGAARHEDVSAIAAGLRARHCALRSHGLTVELRVDGVATVRECVAALRDDGDADDAGAAEGVTAAALQGEREARCRDD